MKRAIRGAIGVMAMTMTLGAETGCKSEDARVQARRIAQRADLIGGPGALGDVDDFLLANEEIRVIVQGEGFSRGFGLYGGSLIDADLQRPAAFGDSSGGRGFDNFSELFPALFLKAMNPFRIDTRNNADGSASVIVQGRTADFVFLAEAINELLVDSRGILFQNEYRLAPGKRYVEIITTFTNNGGDIVEFPSEGIASFIGDASIEFPVGDVILFGAGNSVFAEGAGFDIRFTLEDRYREPIELPRLPGLVTPFLATRGDNVSYGFMSGITNPEVSFVDRTEYPGARTDDLVVPFLASAFTGAFYGAAPKTLAPQQSFTIKKYFIVGGGDVASIRDVVHEIRQTQVGQLGGVVRERLTQEPENEASIVVFTEDGSPFNQHDADDNGNFKGMYPPGRYQARIVADGRFPAVSEIFEIRAGERTFIELELDSPGWVVARVVGEDGERLPAKCSLVGRYPEPAIDPIEGRTLFGREFLHDLRIGERDRPIDLEPDTEDPATREFVEEILLVNGQVRQRVRPGSYRAVCSRGLEYSLWEADIEVRPAETTQIDAYLERTIDTRGWASGDFHLHSGNSVDSSMALDNRVLAVAAEGVDVACSSDHNFVTDYSGAIFGQDLNRWVQGMVGLEMTTLEIGHFNGFPLRYNTEPITKGAFEWSGVPPQRLFDNLRALGSRGPDNTIIQVNHPRDSILGYFNDYGFNSDTGELDPPSGLLAPTVTETNEFGGEKFSWDFDAIEIYNGKRFELLYHYRVPEELPPPPLPDVIPPAGEILRDESGTIAFPGGLDDWFTLLNTGRVYTAMGNSDTHGPEDEPGIPRTFMPVSDDRPGAVPELDVVRAIQNQQTFLTNGPFALLQATGNQSCRSRKTQANLGRTTCGLGEVVVATDGQVQARVDIQTAPWIDLNRVDFILSTGRRISVSGNRDTLRTVTQAFEMEQDGWFIVEMAGSQSMFPVALPREIPSVQVSDALGSVGSAFGINLSPFGNLRPSEITTVYPYAFSNPIFIDTDGDGVWNAPGLQNQALTAEAPRSSGQKLDLRGAPQLTKLFGLFNCGHGH